AADKNPPACDRGLPIGRAATTRKSKRPFQLEARHLLGSKSRALHTSEACVARFRAPPVPGRGGGEVAQRGWVLTMIRHRLRAAGTVEIERPAAQKFRHSTLFRVRELLRGDHHYACGHLRVDGFGCQ